MTRLLSRFMMPILALITLAFLWRWMATQFLDKLVTLLP